MPFDFKLPDLGKGIVEIELRKWLVKEGDRIKEHQDVAILGFGRIVERPWVHRSAIAIRKILHLP